jgi:ATP-dependent DNA helicase PIF1
MAEPANKRPYSDAENYGDDYTSTEEPTIVEPTEARVKRALVEPVPPPDAQWWPKSVGYRSVYPLGDNAESELLCRVAVMAEEEHQIIDSIEKISFLADFKLLLEHIPTPNLRFLSQTCVALWAACRDTLQKRMKLGRYHPLCLTSDQLRIANTALYHKLPAVFMTGQAGSGKSVVLRYVVAWDEFYKRKVAQVAPTGYASIQLDGGQTLHSFLGLQPQSNVMLRNFQVSKERRLKLRKYHRIIVEEISMVSADMLDYFDHTMRSVHERPDLPFGGVEMLLAGDFLQLPPIVEKERKHKAMAFQADVWPQLFPPSSRVGVPPAGCFQLEMSLRQDNLDFCWALHQVRFGFASASPLVCRVFGPCAVDELNEEQKEAILIHTHVKPADEENRRRLALLEARTRRTYSARDFGDKAAFKARVQAPEELELRTGARVMLLRNINPEKRLVNGMTGKVTGFIDVRNIERSGIPLLATMGDPCSFIGTRCVVFTGEADQPRYKNRRYEVTELPIVLFDCGEKCIVAPFTFGIERTEKKTKKMIALAAKSGTVLPDTIKLSAGRVQLPLQLAWATSVHKVQGMNLRTRGRINMGRAFSPGQVYVQLSRFASLDILIIEDLNWSKIFASREAMDFYARMFGPPKPLPESIITRYNLR